MSRTQNRLDLTGQRFGRLTALRPAERINGRTAWQCRCDCGREPVVRTWDLWSGHTSSCGCASSKKHPKHALGLSYVDGTCLEMLRAKTVRKNNTSGVPGVDWRESKHCWRASICFKGRRYYLGSYKKFEDAVQARKLAEENLHDSFLREFAVRSDGG